MRGLAIEFTGDFIPTEQFGCEVVGVVIDQKFPVEVAKAMIETCPWEQVTWVIRDTDLVARRLFDGLGIEPVFLPLNPFFKVGDTDVRRVMRDCELMYGCTHLLIFKDKDSDANGHWASRASARAKIHVIEHKRKKGKA